VLLAVEREKVVNPFKALTVWRLGGLGTAQLAVSDNQTATVNSKVAQAACL
jgi:hypothetical protein